MSNNNNNNKPTKLVRLDWWFFTQSNEIGHDFGCSVGLLWFRQQKEWTWEFLVYKIVHSKFVYVLSLSESDVFDEAKQMDKYRRKREQSKSVAR